MANTLYVGLTKTIDLPKGGFLLIDDEVPKLPDWKRSRVFDPDKHSIDFLKGKDEKKAAEIAAGLYAIRPEAETTLTVRNGKRALRDALLEAKSFDKIGGDEEVRGMVGDILFYPVLRQVLCNPTNFSFAKGSMNYARLNRAELGEDVALVLGVLLMSHFKGQIIVPDFGFYGRDIHARLMREKRLIAGVNFLDELPKKLRQRCLLIKDKRPSGAMFDDAEELAKYLCKHPPRTDGYDTFIKKAMA